MPIREDDTSNEAVAERLRAAIKARGTTPARLAEQLKVSQSRVSNWTTGQTPPKRTDTFALCDALGITIDFLLRGRIKGMEWSMVEDLRSVAAEGVPPVKRTTKTPRNREPEATAPKPNRARRATGRD